jgi:hypothetical protein
VGVQPHVPAALPLGMNQYLLFKKLGGPHGRSGRVRKISPPPGFDPPTVQPVASRYAEKLYNTSVSELNVDSFSSYSRTPLSVYLLLDDSLCYFRINYGIFLCSIYPPPHHISLYDVKHHTLYKLVNDLDTKWERNVIQSHHWFEMHQPNNFLKM